MPSRSILGQRLHPLARKLNWAKVS